MAGEDSCGSEISTLGALDSPVLSRNVESASRLVSQGEADDGRMAQTWLTAFPVHAVVAACLATNNFRWGVFSDDSVPFWKALELNPEALAAEPPAAFDRDSGVQNSVASCLIGS